MLSSLTPACIEHLVEMRTPLIVLENVVQLVNSVNGRAAFQLAREAGYHVSIHTTHAERYGPPYKRRRSLVVMARGGKDVRDALAAAALEYAREEVPPPQRMTLGQLLGLKEPCFWSAPRSREARSCGRRRGATRARRRVC